MQASLFIWLQCSVLLLLKLSHSLQYKTIQALYIRIITQPIIYDEVITLRLFLSLSFNKRGSNVLCITTELIRALSVISVASSTATCYCLFSDNCCKRKSWSLIGIKQTIVVSKYNEKSISSHLMPQIISCLNEVCFTVIS